VDFSFVGKRSERRQQQQGTLVKGEKQERRKAGKAAAGYLAY
jgi:hypothetical protein